MERPRLTLKELKALDEELKPFRHGKYQVVDERAWIRARGALNWPHVDVHASVQRCDALLAEYYAWKRTEKAKDSELF